MAMLLGVILFTACCSDSRDKNWTRYLAERKRNKTSSKGRSKRSIKLVINYLRRLSSSGFNTVKVNNYSTPHIMSTHTWGCCSCQEAAASVALWTAPSSLSGLFPCEERDPTQVQQTWNQSRSKIYIVLILYTPCCFKPVIVEFKGHERFRKFSQVTLQSSCQNTFRDKSEFKKAEVIC